jgi:quinol monooxygenase YgiN
MTNEIYTLAKWIVKPGHEDDFVAAWKALGTQFRKLPSPPIGDGILLQSLTDPAVHYSFGPWKSASAVAAMREDPKAQAVFQKVVDQCEDVEPDGFRPIAKA